MLDKNEINSFLIGELCKTIALHERFSLDDIKNGYNELRSLDRLMEAIAAAKDHKTSLTKAIEEMLIPTGKVAEIIKKSLPFKPSASRSTISFGIDLGFGPKKKKIEPEKIKEEAAIKAKKIKKPLTTKAKPIKRK